MALAKNLGVELAPLFCAQMNSGLSRVYPSGGDRTSSVVLSEPCVNNA